MIGIPGPVVHPVVRLIFLPPRPRVRDTGLGAARRSQAKTPVVDNPLVSSSSIVAIAFEANPAANSGAAASATAVRSFLLRDAFITATPELSIRSVWWGN